MNNITKEELNSKYIFPCGKHCPVFACCDIWCVKVFEYCNFIAENIYIMEHYDRELYRKTTPRLIQRKIQKMYMYKKAITFPPNYKLKRSESWSV